MISDFVGNILPRNTIAITAYESLATLRRDIEMNIAKNKVLDARTKFTIQEVANAVESAFADRAILLDESMLLFERESKQ
jgi:hypothetical protein